MEQPPVSDNPTPQIVPQHTPEKYLTVQQREIFQTKTARIAFVGLIFLILFSLGAGLYWFSQNKAILQQAKTSTTVTKTSIITPVENGGQQEELMINPHALPLGDGKISSSPKQGYVYSCQTSFRGGGAQGTASWIDGDTWDLAEKPSVDGSVSWPNAQLSISIQNNKRIIKGNGLPVGATTGAFPIQSSDPAYAYDTNPNSISPQTISLSLPQNPTMGTPSCVPMGMIGVAINGVPIFNALDDGGRDAVAREVQDSCNGHPQQQGMYHYHGPSPCISGSDKPDTLIGYALDGVGIYSGVDDNGDDITNSDLDECHGITSQVMWDGKKVTIYHYVMTQEYPYSVGCFRGSTVVKVTSSQPMQPMSGVGQNRLPPPPPPGNGY